MTVLEGLKAEGAPPPLVVWALAQEISTLSQLKLGISKGRKPAELMSKLRIWQSRQAATSRALARYSNADLCRLLERVVAVDRAAKGLDALPVWEAITGLVLDLLAPKSHRLSA
jgi:DNA polymerase-3 subunit delta